VRRRYFIALLASSAAGWPLVAHTQQPQTPARVGLLPMGSPSNPHDLSYVEALRNGLIDNGLVEGRNVTLDILWVANESHYDQAVIELVRRGAKVLVAAGSNASAAAKRQTLSIPIVFVVVGDPVSIGLVESLSHPGGNATGFTDMFAELSSKFVELARELSTPGVPIGHVWYDKWSDGYNRLVVTEQTAKASGVELRSRAISDISELDGAIAELKSKGMTIIIVQPSPYVYRHRNRIIQLLRNNGLAMLCANPTAVEGAVVGYGPDYVDIYRRAGSYVSRILKGEKPADLPVQNPTKFRLIINLNAAKTIGLQIPTTLLATADEVIE
jgi:putative ABC transport system substrate-binding protein